MTMRRWLLGVIATMMCSAAMAAPPRGSLSEGREVDPVVRDFQLGEAPAIGGATPSRIVENPGDSALTTVLALICDLILNRMTIPLGTATTGEVR